MGKGKAPKDQAHCNPDAAPQGAMSAPWVIFFCPFSICPKCSEVPAKILLPPPDDFSAFLWAHYSAEMRLSGPSSVAENVVKCER